jgi:hypothetical protein
MGLRLDYPPTTSQAVCHACECAKRAVGALPSQYEPDTNSKMLGGLLKTERCYR